MSYKAINIDSKLQKFNEHWQPKVIAEMNDYQFKLAKIEGEFVWHKHSETDEVFIVVEGAMEIHFRDGSVCLKKGEMFVVPKGVEHKPMAEKESHILLVEPKGVVNTGEIDGEVGEENRGDLTAENDVWV